MSKNERGGCEKGRAGLDYLVARNPRVKNSNGYFSKGLGSGCLTVFCLLTIPAHSSVKITGYSQDNAWGYGAVSSTETHLNNLVDQ
jgi:hypothetical protein